MSDKKTLTGAERLLQIENEKRETKIAQHEVAKSNQESFETATTTVKRYIAKALAREHSMFTAHSREGDLNSINERQSFSGATTGASRMAPFASLSFLRSSGTYGWVVIAIDTHGTNRKFRVLTSTTVDQNDKNIACVEYESFDPLDAVPITQEWVNELLSRAIVSLA